MARYTEATREYSNLVVEASKAGLRPGSDGYRQVRMAYAKHAMARELYEGHIKDHDCRTAKLAMSAAN